MKNPMNKELTINVKLFRKIQKAILRWPESFNMGTFDGQNTGSYQGNNKVIAFDPSTMKAPDCGSVCCLAGWGMILGKGKSLKKLKLSGFQIQDEAEELLGLTNRQASRIFFFRGGDGLGDTTPQEAAAMIDRFIADPSADEFN